MDDQVLPLRTIQHWSKWFHQGRDKMEDEQGSGRPITEITSENMHDTIQRAISDHLELS